MAIAAVRAARRAVVSGTMPRPTPASTMRQTASKLRSCTRSRERPADAGRLVGEEALQGARPVEADEIVAEHLGEGDLGRAARGWPCGHDEDEAVGAERVGVEPAGIDRAGDDADIADALGDQADDLVREPLLEVDR